MYFNYFLYKLLERRLYLFCTIIIIQLMIYVASYYIRKELLVIGAM